VIWIICFFGQVSSAFFPFYYQILIFTSIL
jgi:hypothetical protein